MQPAPKPCTTRPARLFSEVLADLAGDDPERRWQAAEGLRRLGSEAVRKAVRPLVACLDDESTRVRVAAAWALLGASPLPEEFLPFLMAGLLSERADQRAWCCSLIGETGTTHPGVRRTLELLAEGDPDEDVRWRDAMAVRELEGVETRAH